jgi:type II secretory pathway component GspD/PulD (secretin)
VVTHKIRTAITVVSIVVSSHAASEVPAQPGQNLPPLKPLTVTQLDDRLQGDIDSPRPVSISLAEPTPIADLLVLLVRGTRLSIVADPDVDGTFRGELRDVTMRQALELILRPHGLDYTADGSAIRVFRRRTETRRFDLNFATTRRMSTRTVAASNTIASTGAQGSAQTISASDQGDVFADLSTGVQTLLSPQGRFNMDRKAALLQVSDYPEKLDEVQRYLEAVQTNASRQVQIQAKVVEVDLYDPAAAGLDWNRVLERAGDAVQLTQPAPPSSAGSFALGLHVRNVGGLLSAMAVQGTVKVLASPMVDALNNETVMMRIGTQNVFFRTTAQVEAPGGRIVQTTVDPQSITEGIVLSVTPQIAGDGSIAMSITPSLTERTGEAISRFGDTAPVLSVREADTLVRVRERDTIVIAGLLDERVRREEHRVPVLGDIPGLGAAFRSERTSRRRTDLIILLTPTITTVARNAQSAAPLQQRAGQ